MVLGKLLTSGAKVFFRVLLMSNFCMKEAKQFLFRLNKDSREFN